MEFHVDMYVEEPKAHLIDGTDLQDWHLKTQEMMVKWIKELKEAEATKKVTEHREHEGHMTVTLGPAWLSVRLDGNAQ